MSNVDPSEAPRGYRAEAPQNVYLCNGCDLRGMPECASAVCGKYGRKDGCYAIFKRIGPVMAIDPTPCDDMGTPMGLLA